MKCLIMNKQCKFWNEIIGCDDHTNIMKCDKPKESDKEEPIKKVKKTK